MKVICQISLDTFTEFGYDCIRLDFWWKGDWTVGLCVQNRQLGNRWYVRLLTFVLLVIFMSSCCVCFAAGSTANPYVSAFNCDFESCVPGNSYTNRVPGSNISSLDTDSRVMVVGKEATIGDSNSLRVNRCDLRWTDFHIENFFFKISFKIKLDKGFNQDIALKLSTQDSLTELDSDAGILLSIHTSSGDIVLQGSDMTTLMSLRTDTVYSIELLVERGSDTVLVKVNGKELTKRYSFVSKLYFIDGISFFSESDKNQDGSWILDDVDIAAKGRTYAQKYSVQSPGEPVQVQVPETVVDKEFKVYVNDKQIGIYDFYVSSQVVYISAKQFLDSVRVSYSYDEKQQLLTVENERVKASVSVPGNVVTINGTDVTMMNPVRTIDGVVMIPPNFINEVFNAKVWWDSAQNLLVVTTGTYKNDGILRKISSKLYMNGEPYYAIGYSTMDVFHNVLERYLAPDNTTVESWTQEANALLADLHAQGVRTIRISCDQNLLTDLIYDDVSTGKYFEAMDALFDLCDQYGIQVVACLQLISENFVAKEYVPRYGWISTNESLMDLVTDDQCASRNVLRLFVERFVNRYKNRNTILMYEISDNANFYADTGHYHQAPTYSIAQLASFYRYCVDLIRTYDSVRLIGSGDGLLLPYQWSLYKQIMAAGGDASTLNGMSFALDSKRDFLMAFKLLNECLDIVSIQNPDALFQELNKFYLNKDDVNTTYGYSNYLFFAEMMEKPLYNSKGREDVLSEFSIRNAVLSGVQLSFWNNLSDEDVAQNYQLLLESNMINYCDTENTNRVWEDSNVDIFDPNAVISIDESSVSSGDWNRVIRFAVIFGIMALSSCLIIFAFRNKKVV